MTHWLSHNNGFHVCLVLLSLLHTLSTLFSLLGCFAPSLSLSPCIIIIMPSYFHVSCSLIECYMYKSNSLTLSLSFFLTQSLSFSLSHWLSPYLFLSYSLFLTDSLSLSYWLYLSISLTHSLFFFLSPIVHQKNSASRKPLTRIYTYIYIYIIHAGKKLTETYRLHTCIVYKYFYLHTYLCMSPK